MGFKRRDVISFLLIISTLSMGQLMVVATAPIHEFGHYIVAKSFEWNITEVDWYSHVAYTEESIDNASRIQKLIVSIVGPIFTPIIPYILILLTSRSRTIRDILVLPYLGLGILESGGDLKKVIWYLLVNAPMPKTELEASVSMNIVIVNIVISILTTVGLMWVVYMVAVRRYKQCVIELSTVIDELDDHDEEVQKNGE